MFNRSAYENSRPDGISVLEVVDGAPSKKDGPRLFVPLKKTVLNGEVTGPLASLRLTQVYGYSRKQCDRVLEAVYRFPLPGDAAVTAVRVRFGDVEIEAELKKRQKAEAEYEAAKASGRQAALATRESPDVFTLQVAGIQPDQDITVETSYVQLARAEGTGWSLRVPLTTSPRYVRSDELTSRHAHGQPLALLRDPGHRFSLDVLLHAAESVESATHTLGLTEADGSVRLQLRDGEILPDRDLILSWQPKQEKSRPTLQVLLHNVPDAAHVYFLALVAPPADPEPSQVPTREVILLVDHSGSMEGAKWQAADWAVKGFLSGLGPRDAFALGLFHNTTEWFSPRPSVAEAEVVAKAVRFLTAHTDSGGTELGVALEQALGLTRAPGDPVRHVLIVTDAEVSDAGRILRLAEEEWLRSDRRRISVLCIDAAPNSFLALSLAERGGGVARFLTSAPEEEDITTALDQVLADWSQPVFAGLRLEVDRAGAEASGHGVAAGSRAGWSGIDLGDLVSGRPVWVAGRVPRAEATGLSFRLASAGIAELASSRAGVAQQSDLRPSLKALFGAGRVAGLEFLINSGYSGDELSGSLRRLGYDPDLVMAPARQTPPKVYAENTRADAALALRDLLVQEALEYGLASAETAFVAVRKEAGKPVEGTVAVANALPAGWSEGFLSPNQASMTVGLGSGAMLSASMPAFLRASRASFEAAPRGAMMADSGDAVPEAEPAKPSAKPVFSGIPSFVSGEAVLFDSTRPQDAGKIPDHATISQLELRFPDGAPKPDKVDGGLCLLIFVDDAASPRAKVRLVDLIRQGMRRPLNLLRQAGQVVRIVLLDPAGAWASNAPRIEVALEW